jgi:hypothetical protein
MGIFSLNWFKSEKQKQLEQLQLEEQALKNTLLRKKIESAPETTSIQTTTYKPYIKIKLVNNVLTVVLNDGSLVSKTNATEQDFNDARNSKTEEQLLRIMSIEEVKEQKDKISKRGEKDNYS